MSASALAEKPTTEVFAPEAKLTLRVLPNPAELPVEEVVPASNVTALRQQQMGGQNNIWNEALRRQQAMQQSGGRF